MGDWRTVNIIGSCDPSEVERLRSVLAYDFNGPTDQKFYALGHSTPGSVCGLSAWPAATIRAVGNLHERDYDPEDVAEELRELVGVAPSLRVMIHCGGPNESLECVATIVVGEDGTVGLLPPAVVSIEPISEEQMRSNMRRWGFPL